MERPLLQKQTEYEEQMNWQAVTVHLAKQTFCFCFALWGICRLALFMIGTSWAQCSCCHMSCGK